MAKDNRQKKRMKAAKKAARAAKRGNGAQTQVPLRGGSASQQNAGRTSARSKTQNGVPVGKIILAALALIFLIALIVFGVYLFRLVKSFSNDAKEQETSTVITSQENSNVAYYVIGMMGKEKADGTTGRTQMLSLVCYDKKAKTVNVMQIPTGTYLGDTEHFAVKTVGGVWSSPKPLQWCETCGKQVFEPQITDGKHNEMLDDGKTVCNTKITTKTGSAVGNLMDVFSIQYSINIDNYYIFPQPAFVKLVDLVGGVDVKLGSAMTLADIPYEAGVQTLDGESALEYVLGDWGSVKGELGNLTRQRQVYVALFERLMQTDKDSLYDDVLYPLMKGSTPIRTKRDHDIADDIQLMTNLLVDLNKVDRSAISICILPGEIATKDGTAFYSVHKDELATLLNASFNPYGQPVEEKNLKMEEISNTEKADLKTATFDKLLVKQSGIIEEKEEDE